MLRWTVNLNGPGRCYAAVTVGHKVYAIGRCNSNVNNSDQVEVHVLNTVSLRWRKMLLMTPGREPHLEVPSMRWGRTAVLIADNVYLWGGFTNPGYCNVLHAFDVDAHRWFKPQVSGTVPEGRRHHSACVLGKVMYIHGGWNQTGYTNDIYKLDTTTMVWSLINTRGTPPPASYHHSGTIIGTKMILFGGYGGQYYNTMRVFDTETDLWLNTPSAQLLPEGRRLHSAFTYNGELYIFGGWNGGEFLNDLWKFSPETFSCKKVEPKGNGPPPTSWHILDWMHAPCTGCMVGDRIILFGGGNKYLYVLDFSPSLKTLCKLAVIQYDLEQSDLTHDIRWELAAMTTNSNKWNK